MKNIKITKSNPILINFVDKSDGVISPAPENLKITSDNINQIKNVVNTNSNILSDLINNPPTSQTRFFEGEIKQFETRALLDKFINNLGLRAGTDYLIFTEKFFLNNNSNSTGTFFSGGSSVLTKNHFPLTDLTHAHLMPSRSNVFGSSGGNNIGIIATSRLQNVYENRTNVQSLIFGSSSPQTIYNLIYYKDVVTIKFLRNI